MLVAKVLVAWLLAFSMVYVSVVIGAARLRSVALHNLNPRTLVRLTVRSVSLVNRLSIAAVACWVYGWRNLDSANRMLVVPFGRVAVGANTLGKTSAPV